jgi:hypothetical protein
MLAMVEIAPTINTIGSREEKIRSRHPAISLILTMRGEANTRAMVQCFYVETKNHKFPTHNCHLILGVIAQLRNAAATVDQPPSPFEDLSQGLVQGLEPRHCVSLAMTSRARSADVSPAPRWRFWITTCRGAGEEA